MNRIYSVVWNYFKEDYVVASELASRKRVKSKISKMAIMAFTFISLLGFPVLSQEVVTDHENILDKDQLLDPIPMLPKNSIDQVVSDNSEEKQDWEEEEMLKKARLVDNQPSILLRNDMRANLLPDDEQIRIGKDANTVGAYAIAIGASAQVKAQGGNSYWERCECFSGCSRSGMGGLCE
ncbi:ESPR-type extended signal peptide-containing protein [Ignatzschineria larvae DSM 13226]|uniref:ESPR-type extended signal peptide-containing protein n=1 Tax=Ignatzschineria larvae DSM 13226 TaxID=1111732 RepID=A0ABZ3BXJ5_9GAMM|nr:ESPR-type extended signal peptide-containing protein [Ignatzschineria larvae]